MSGKCAVALYMGSWSWRRRPGTEERSAAVLIKWALSQIVQIILSLHTRSSPRLLEIIVSRFAINASLNCLAVSTLFFSRGLFVHVFVWRISGLRLVMACSWGIGHYSDHNTLPGHVNTHLYLPELEEAVVADNSPYPYHYSMLLDPSPLFSAWSCNKGYIKTGHYCVWHVHLTVTLINEYMIV